jgi:hypothetical protein
MRGSLELFTDDNGNRYIFQNILLGTKLKIKAHLN